MMISRLCFAQAMKADSMSVVAEERDREVRGILASIADLAQIMKDLSTLVIDQGTVLDRIDYNMEQARSRLPLPALRFSSLQRAFSRSLPMLYASQMRMPSHWLHDGGAAGVNMF